MGASGLLGNFDALGTSTVLGTGPANLSEQTKIKLDNDTQKILADCLSQVEEILNQEKDLFEHFAQSLIEKEELEYTEIIEIFDKYGKERRQTPPLYPETE